MSGATSPHQEKDLDQLRERIRELERRLEAEKSAGVDRFRFAVEAAPNGILMADASGRITLANQRVREMFGYTEEEMAGLPVEALMPERFRRGHVHHRDQYHQAPTPRPMGTGRDLYAQRKDGSEFPVEIGLTPLSLEGGERLVLGMITDISERKKAEMALHDKARILANLHEAVFTLDAKGIVETWNEGATLIFGWHDEEIIGRPVTLLCPEDDSHRFHERVQPALREIGHYESNLRCLHRSGTEIRLAIRASLIDPDAWSRDGTGRTIICANDITRQKELEEEIVQISEKEQRRIGQDLHDDLCQQLASIACLTQVLQQRVAAGSKHEDDTAEALGQIGEMISQANVRAREISRGLAPAVIEREGLTSALVELASRTQRIFGIPCRFHCPDPIFVDDEKVAVQLYRIAQEATANAVRHSDCTGIDLHLDLRPGHLQLRIRDDGRGLLPSTEDQGSGMGLLTMAHRARILDGDLDIDSSPGKGTTITCTTVHENE